MKTRLGKIASLFIAMTTPSVTFAQSMMQFDGEMIGRVRTISSVFSAKDGHLYDVKLDRTDRGTIQIAINCDGHSSVRSEVSEKDMAVKERTGAPVGLHLWLGRPSKECSRAFTLQIYFIGNIASEGPSVNMTRLMFNDGELRFVGPTSLDK